MDKKYSIGVFDSGVGGLTVLKELIDLLPYENIIYYGDSGNSPYGDKTQEEIEKLCIKIVEFLIEKNCKIIVIACNTATKAAIETLKEKFDIPIIGVIEPGARKALEVTKNKNISILSTVFTAKTNAYKEQLEKLSKEVQVDQIGCKELCPMIENGWETHEDRLDILKSYISTMDKDSDTVILGCTHYPLIVSDIKPLVGNRTIVDPAAETAQVVKNYLEKEDLFNDSKENGKVSYYVSGNIKMFQELAEKFLSKKIDEIYQATK